MTSPTIIIMLLKMVCLIDIRFGNRSKVTTTESIVSHVSFKLSTMLFLTLILSNYGGSSALAFLFAYYVKRGSFRDLLVFSSVLLRVIITIIIR